MAKNKVAPFFRTRCIRWTFLCTQQKSNQVTMTEPTALTTEPLKTTKSQINKADKTNTYSHRPPGQLTDQVY